MGCVPRLWLYLRFIHWFSVGFIESGAFGYHPNLIAHSAGAAHGRNAQLRSHDRGPQGVHAALEDQPAAVQAGRAERAGPRIQVRGIRGRSNLRSSAEAAEPMSARVTYNWRPTGSRTASGQ